MKKFTFFIKNSDKNSLMHKNALWVYIWRPYKELFHNGNLIAAVLWFIFTIFAAQIGTLVNIIKHVIFHDGQGKPVDFDFWKSVQESIYLDSISGSFYTFAIVLVASVLSPLFIQLIEDKEVHFKRPKVFSIVICIFTLFFGGVFFSFSSLNPSAYEGLKNMNFCIDKSQSFFFGFSILAASYTFALTRMDKDRNKDIDDYLSDQKKRIEILSEEENIETIEDNIKV